MSRNHQFTLPACHRSLFFNLLLFHNTLRHGPQKIGRTWGKLKKTARFEKLENLCSIFQNGLVFLRRIGKASLSEFPEIYTLCYHKSTKSSGAQKVYMLSFPKLPNGYISVSQPFLVPQPFFPEIMGCNLE
jgi:hypothetical protein